MKDQTDFLAQITDWQLQKALFPIDIKENSFFISLIMYISFFVGKDILKTNGALNLAPFVLFFIINAV